MAQTDNTTVYKLLLLYETNGS